MTLQRLRPYLKFIMFADDTNVFLSHKSIDKLFEIMNTELLKIAGWFNTNKLSLNSTQTNYILFRSARKIATGKSLYINNSLLSQISSTKFLGVVIDQHLTWKDHISLMTNKISKNIDVIARIRHLLPTTILISLYYTLIFPYLISYCNIVWGASYKSHFH